MDDSQGSGVEWVVTIIMVPVETVVDNNHRVAMIAERTPADVIMATVPMDPRWTPITSGNPVPSETDTPMPSAVVVNTPTPRFVGDPIPTDDRVPCPATIVIRTPIMIVVHSRNPDITIGSFINPPAVIGELCLVFIKLFRKISLS